MTKLVFNALTGTFDLVQNLSGYALLAGRAGGQTLIGGSAVTDALVLQGTSGNGTAASPAVQMKAGNNGATTALTVLNNGNVGIGTTSPSYKLQVVNSSGSVVSFERSSTNLARVDGTNGFLDVISSNNSNPVLYVKGTGTADLVNIFDNTTEVFTILDGGNVGIGTTSPTALLDLKSTNGGDTDILRISNHSGSAGSIYGLAWRDTANNKTYARIASSYGASYVNSYLSLSVADSTETLLERMRIDKSGNVGIGTTSPAQQLDLTKSMALTATTNANQYGILYKGASRFLHDFNYGNNGTVTTAGQNIFLGLNAGNLTMGSTATLTAHASYNTGIGAYALVANTTGFNNSAQGAYALYANTTGSYNSAQGAYALYANTTGSSNSAQGLNALYANTTGSYNSAQGVNALYANTTGFNNSAQGAYALYANTTGSYNSAQGAYALYANTTGSYNSAQGVNALYANTTGSSNSAQGVNAGRFIADGATANQTSNNSLYLGYSTRALASGDTNEIVIGASAIGNGSNSVTLGNTSITKTILQGNVGIGTTSPEARLHIKAGTASVNTAPLKFTSGTLNTTAEAGAVEFLTDDFFATITTGAARKAFVLDDGTRLTATRIPFATTNGRLTDDADLTFVTDTLTATKMVGTTSIKVGTAGGYLSSDGSAGATGTFTTVDGKTCTVKDGLITSIV